MLNRENWKHIARVAAIAAADHPENADLVADCNELLEKITYTGEGGWDHYSKLHGNADQVAVEREAARRAIYRAEELMTELQLNQDTVDGLLRIISRHAGHNEELQE